MLVPFVLRSIVLPYLRSATGSTSSSASASATVVRAVPTARTRLRLAGSRSASTATAAATSSARAGLGDDGFGRAWPVEVSGVSAPRHPAPTSPASRAQEQVAPLTRSKYGPPERSMDARQEPEQPKKSNNIFDKVPGPARLDIPPAVAKLLNAKLYRMTVFHLLETPAYLADVALVEYVIGRLEKAGAGKLAARLRRTLAYWTDMGPEERAAAKPRLMPLERASSEPRPPTYWRVPNIPRDPSEYRGTPAERRTHYMNHRITSYLTVQHPAPYGMPRPPWPAPPLGRVQDVLKMIDRLRVTSNFVPDRVTVNIVVKAWLMSLSRRQDWGRLPLAHRKRDLRDIFGLVSSSIERGGSSSGSGVLHRPEEGEDGEPPLPFNGSVDYDRHVAPLAKTIIGAMRRVGDHDAIAAVKRWSEEMKVKLKEHKE